MQTFGTSRFIHLADHRLHYRVFGTGRLPFAYFHGFGQNIDTFAPPSNWLSKYTFYVFDLFYHGESEGDDRPLTKRRWQAIFKAFIEEENIQAKSLTLAGYSLGGRFVLAASILCPSYVYRILLIAPDGVYRSPWYRAATSFPPLFRYLMTHPSYFDTIVTLAQRYKLGNPSLIKFSKQELGPKENRMRVYRSWTLFHPLGYSHEELRRHLTVTGVRGTLYLGKKDYVIPVSKVLPILEAIPNIQCIVMPLRHHELVDQALAHIDATGDL